MLTTSRYAVLAVSLACLAPGCARQPSQPAGSDPAPSQPTANEPANVKNDSGPNRLHLIVDVLAADEGLSYDLTLSSDGCMIWSREASDGAEDFRDTCKQCDKREHTDLWLARAGEVFATISTVTDRSTLPADVSELFNRGRDGLRYWLTVTTPQGELEPKAVADLQKALELAHALWADMTPLMPNWERDCQRAPASGDLDEP